MKTYTLTVLFILSAFMPAQSQIIFHKEFPTGTSDVAACLRVADNGYLVSGSRALSTDQNGNALVEIAGLHNRAAYIPTDGGFIAARYGYGVTSVDGQVLRYNATGDVLWERTIEEGLWRNGVEDVIALDDGMFIYAGRHQDVVGSGAVIRKLCPSGGIIWEEIWNLDAWFAGHAYELHPSGPNLYVLGSANGGVVDTDLARDLTLTRHNLATGDLTWDYIYTDDSTQVATDLLVAPAGSSDLFLLGNSTAGAGKSGLLISLSDVDTAVVENWVRQYPLTGASEAFKAIEATADGGFLILGTRAAGDSTFTYVKKLDAAADEEWEYRFANSGSQHVGAEMVADGGDVFTLAGHYLDDANGSENYFLTKFDLAGLNATSVGLPTVKDIEISLYPNPATDYLSIELPFEAATGSVITIVDVYGRVVDIFEPMSGRQTYDCAQLDSGMYLLELSSENYRGVTSFIVE